MKGFVHLHTHSHYSLLEAIPKIPELVATAKEQGQEALALTDNGNMYGAIEFYKTCKKNKIKPIIGVDFFLAPRTRHDKEHRVDEPKGRLVLLAKNETGYRNLIQLVSLSHLEGFYYRPRVDRELLEKYREGLVAILPSHAGEHAHALRHGDQERASQAFEWYKKVYGEDCFAEITKHPEIDGHEERMRAIIEAAKKASVPIVAAHDVYYLESDDSLASDLVNKIRTASTLNRDMQAEPKDFSYISKARMEQLFSKLPEAIENSARIADLCNLELELDRWVFPNFPVSSGTTADEELKRYAEGGFAERNIEKTSEAYERMEYELSVIKKKGYSSYFLVVADLLRHAREKGILTNTRGSAAGSLVSYLTGITTVNPLLYNLPFERFLNPERPSPPDIDMDLADNRRDELIAYVREKYGENKVAQIGTFGTMMARAAVRDVARALGHPYGLGDTIAKLIPFGKQGFPVSIKGSLEEVAELEQVYKKDASAREVLDLAQKIEGNARHVGVHAAGVVIAPTAVTDFCPVQFDPKGGKIITQYDMHAVESAGLLKFDFLGLTNLSVLADSVERVRDRLNVSVDLDHLPLDDKKTYEMLSRGETHGVFQLASSGMTSYLMELKPTSIHDINAMVALYRPGPMNFIPAYIERKRDPKMVKYLEPRMEPILKNSYGVITYQDDVLEIAIKLAGYSWLDADKFRKAMGKKIPAEMEAQKEKFKSGCLANGVKPLAVQRLWEQIETFAAYGFNKSHAASYGNLAYKTAYMKANYPVDYMAALLTADAGDVDKIGETVAECKRMGLAILPPSVNESKGNFTVIDDKHIRFGLYSIKNFGTTVADSIITAREKGPFTDIADFVARIPDKNLNKKSLDALIRSGALDELGERGELLANLDALLNYHREHLKAPTDQGSLFAAAALSSQPTKLKLEKSEEVSVEKKLAWEKELLGLYISGHPLDKHKDKLSRQRMDIKMGKESFPRGAETVIAGFVETVRAILTKNGEKMLFARIADYSDSCEVVAFPRIVKENENLFSPGTCIMVKGKFSDRNGDVSFIAERAKAL
ncbi:DNA polymerase III subunit alpha [Candidatus Parcubacteria bacterium]|nr:MAG: DNA polymerase III subunit alpha [Candidatus Parcubacteria bacterium]